MKESSSTDKTSSPPTRPWWWTLIILIAIPLLLSTILRFWIGVPTEVAASDQLFERLQIANVEVREANSLQFGKMFFCRFQVEPDSLSTLRTHFEDYEQSVGLPEKPISLKLDRPWWDPDLTVEGTTWHRDLVTVWSPKDHPDLFYAVVEGSSAGDEVEVTKTPE